MNKRALTLAVLASLMSTGNTVDASTAQDVNSIIGDCGYEKYDVVESGAAGYCYISPSVERVPYGKEPVFYTVSNPVVLASETIVPSQPVITPEPATVSNNPIVVTEEKPADKPAEETEARQHCDNGEGNGSEGCSPSENGNNDENSTRPNEDHGNPNRP